MASSFNNAEIFPYPDFGKIRIRANEPMASSYLNAHLIRLWADARALEKANTLQKASDIQWGVAKFASVEDIIEKDGTKTAVLTNDVLNRAIDELKKRNLKKFVLNGEMDFSSSYRFRCGEFVMGTGESRAVKVTNNPELVAFADVAFQPLGFDERPFFTARSEKVPSAVDPGKVSAGTINFAKTADMKGYVPFSLYYHRSGYVICRNGRYNDSQNQIRVRWTLFERKQ